MMTTQCDSGGSCYGGTHIAAIIMEVVAKAQQGHTGVFGACRFQPIILSGLFSHTVKHTVGRFTI